MILTCFIKSSEFTIELLPWKRCLNYVMQGYKYDVVFGGGLNDQRRKDYVTTVGYYNVTPTYFYLKEKFFNGIQVQNASDLKKNDRRICGILGFNINYVGNDKLKFSPVPGVPLESFHLMISKKWKYAEAFKAYFNNAIGELRASGELKKLLDKHVKKGP